MLETIGNIVFVDGIGLPALNIQVEGYPQFIKCPDIEECRGHYYGVYFEVPFESGQHWVVDQEADTTIQVRIYPQWKDGRYEEYEEKNFSSWTEFATWAAEAKRK